MSFNNETELKRISFSDKQNKDENIFHQEANFQQPNTNSTNKDNNYFNFNLKTLLTDSIEEIYTNKALNNNSISRISNNKQKNKMFKYSDENIYKITSSDLIEVDNKPNSPQNQIFISQNYITTNSIENDTETNNRQQTSENFKNETNIFNSNINNRYDIYGKSNDIMKTTLETLKYINIVKMQILIKLGKGRKK